MRKSQEVFIGHRRYVDRNNQIISRGGLTVAFKLVPGGVKYAIARCNIADNFNKATGRSKAIGRLEGDVHTRTLAIPQEQIDELNPGQVTGLVLDEACRLTDEVIDERNRQKQMLAFRRAMGM